MAEAPSSPPPSSELPGYQFVRTLGQGNFGKVKLAIELSTGRKVAVKVVKKKNLRTRTDISHMRREIRLLHLLRHPHIASLYDVTYKSDTIYLVMEYCPGGELFDYIVAHKRVSEQRGRHFFSQILSALHYCHSSFILHRDLKPQNILLDENFNLKLVDFGFATNYSNEELISTICGTPYYSSPEVCNCEKYNGPAADIWSLGVVLYVLLTGRLPFKADNVKALYHRIMTQELAIPGFLTPECAHVLKRILARDPKKRATTEELLNCEWLKNNPPNAHIPERRYDITPDAETIEMLREIGFSGTEIRKGFSSHEETAVTCAYHLMAEKRVKDAAEAKEMKEKADEKAEETEKKTPSSPELSAASVRGAGRAPKGASKPPTGVHIPALKMAAIKTPERVEASRRPQSARPAARPVIPVLDLGGRTVEDARPRQRSERQNSLTQTQRKAYSARKRGAETDRASRSRGNSEESNKSSPRGWFSPRWRKDSNSSNNTDSPRKSPRGKAADLPPLPGIEESPKKKRSSSTKFSGALSLFSSSAKHLFSRDQMRVVKGSAAFNVATTSSKTVPEILAELERVLEESPNLAYERSAYVFMCAAENDEVAFELEVVQLKDLKIHGVRFRRMAGDTWAYKQRMHEITADLRL